MNLSLNVNMFANVLFTKKEAPLLNTTTVCVRVAMMQVYWHLYRCMNLPLYAGTVDSPLTDTPNSGHLLYNGHCHMYQLKSP